MTQEQYDALRKKATKVRDLDANWRVAVARTTVNRPKDRLPKHSPAVNVAFIPFKPTGHEVSVDPKRIFAMDLSTAKCGIAWGTAGQKPEGTLQMVTPKELAKGSEGAKLAGIAEALGDKAIEHACGLAILSEFYNTKNMLAIRANSSLRGAVMAALARRGIPCLAVPEITARKAAGVDLSKPADQEEPKGYMKRRARAFLILKGLDHLEEDEGDAAILLMGCNSIPALQGLV